MKTQKLLTYLRKCIDEYELIEKNDRIAVGLSGGKDSLILLYALSELRKFYPKKYELTAVTVDMGFGMDYTPVRTFCEKLSVPYETVQTQIADIIFSERKEENPCSLCSNMRRGALTDAAEKLGCNKLALGHHKDDYLSTLMLSLLYEGRFYTFAPVTHYEDRRIDIIRPMLYVPEAAIANYAEENSFPVVKNSCPADHLTKRAEMSELIRTLEKSYPDVKDRLMHAVVTSDIPDWISCRKGEKDA